MSSTTSMARPDSKVQTTPQTSARPRPRLLFLYLALAFAILIGAGAILCAKFWPFSQKAVLEDLAEAADSQVTIRSYHPTYFPVPGCVLEDVEFFHGPNHLKFITIEKLRIEGSYSGVLRNHVPRIKADGARVFIPPFGTQAPFHSQHSRLVVDEIVANGSAVEFASREPHKEPLRFDVHEAFLTGVRWGDPITYHLKFRNPEPPGELAVSGKFGAWADGHPQDTPMSGEYTFEQADLGVYGGISGILASHGKFDGLLKHVNISGTTDTPDFEVKESGHKVRLRTRFDAYVDATRGDTFLNRVEAQFGRTTVIAEGSVAGTPGSKGKIGKFHLTSRRGRIEDIMNLFVTERSPMSGDISLETRAEVPPGDQRFLQKVRLSGAFGIDEGSFSKAQTQKDVDQLSAGAQGKSKEDPETVLTELKGRVDLNGGLARFSELNFGVPGVQAQMHGTYNILNHKIDLHGMMQVDTKISKTSSGMKSLLLKVIDPLFKKKKKGEIVPVHIAGTYEQPQFGLDLANSGTNNPPKQH